MQKKKSLSLESHDTDDKQSRVKVNIPSLINHRSQAGPGRVTQSPSLLPSDITPDSTVTDSLGRWRPGTDHPSFTAVPEISYVTSGFMDVLRRRPHSSASCQHLWLRKKCPRQHVPGPYTAITPRRRDTDIQHCHSYLILKVTF